MLGLQDGRCQVSDPTTMPAGPVARPPGPPAGVRGAACALLVLGAVVCFGSLLLVGAAVFGSLWEGGDQALKHRILMYGPFGGLANFGAGVLLCAAAAPVAAGRAAAWTLLKTCAGVLVALTAGWALILGSAFVTDAVDAFAWLLFVAPAPLAALIYWAGRPSDDADGAGVGA